MRFSAGQFNMLYVFGMGEVPISISGDPSNTETLTHTVRAVGGVTSSMSDLKEGDTIGVRGPFGVGWPVERAEGKDIVIAAGGIGLAPLRSVVLNTLANRSKYGKVALLYGTRTPDDIVYEGEIKKWRGRFDMQVEVSVDSAKSGWHGAVGVVTTLVPKVEFDPENTIAMICGPEVMMRFTVLELMKMGVSEESIFLSMERNMKCGVGLCGHCQMGPLFVCKDGPVFAYPDVKRLMEVREV